MLATLGATTAGSRAAAPQLDPIDVAFTIEDPLPEVASTPVVATPPALPAVRPEKPRPRSPSEASQTALTISPPEVTKPSRNPNLDPAAAVRALFLSQESFPGGETRETSSAVTARSNDRETPNYFEGVGNKRYLSQREPPKLRRRRDGTYRYRGQAFEAIVAKDGSVTFDEGYKQGTTVSFDITDALMRRRGEDPYRYEKDWCLESTTAFRQALLERWKADQSRLARQKLRVRLLRISEDATLSAAQKEARVLSIFQNTADGEAGAGARETIAEFVATRMPDIVLSEPTP